MYKTIVRPAMLYGIETVTMIKRQERKMEVGINENAEILVGGDKGEEA